MTTRRYAPDDPAATHPADVPIAGAMTVARFVAEDGTQEAALVFYDRPDGTPLIAYHFPGVVDVVAISDALAQLAADLLEHHGDGR